MKLTTRSRYGTRMILDIAQQSGDAPVRIADIAKRQNVSVKYLEKLVRELRKAGFIKSKRGPKGGHVLAKEPEEILLGDVVMVLEGEDCLVECRAGTKGCERAEECLTRRLWQEAYKAMYERLNSYSIADLMASEAECPGGHDMFAVQAG